MNMDRFPNTDKVTPLGQTVRHLLCLGFHGHPSSVIAEVVNALLPLKQFIREPFITKDKKEVLLVGCRHVGQDGRIATIWAITDHNQNIIHDHLDTALLVRVLRHI